MSLSLEFLIILLYIQTRLFLMNSVIWRSRRIRSGLKNLASLYLLLLLVLSPAVQFHSLLTLLLVFTLVGLLSISGRFGVMLKTR